MEAGELLRQIVTLIVAIGIYIPGRKVGYFPKFRNMVIDMAVLSLQIVAIVVLLQSYAEVYRLSFVPGSLW